MTKKEPQSTPRVIVAPAPAGPIKVRATQTGYYHDRIYHDGDSFTIGSVQEFSKRWMEKE